jgi:hypothetical protein
MLAAAPAHEIIEDVRMIAPQEPYAWLLPAGLGLAAALLLALLIWRLAKKHQLPFQHVPPPPDRVALERLSGIRHLIADGKHMEFVIASSGILRDYVQARFELRAPHLSTEEFQAERSESLPGDRREALSGFLSRCDQIPQEGRGEARGQGRAENAGRQHARRKGGNDRGQEAGAGRLEELAAGFSRDLGERVLARGRGPALAAAGQKEMAMAKTPAADAPKRKGKHAGNPEQKPEGAGKPEDRKPEGAGDKADAAQNAAELRQGIGHMEKAAQSFAQAEALAPGKNDAANQQAEALAQLAEMRAALDQAQNKPPGAGKPGYKPGDKLGDQPGAPSDQLAEGKEPAKAASQSPMKPVLKFSDIRTAGQPGDGVFKDLRHKSKIRDW